MNKPTDKETRASSVQAQQLDALPLLKFSLTRLLNRYRNIIGLTLTNTSRDEIYRQIQSTDTITTGFGMDLYFSDEEWDREGERWQAEIDQAFPKEER